MKKSISKRKNTFRSGRTKNNRTMRKRKNKTVKRKIIYQERIKIVVVMVIQLLLI